MNTGCENMRVSANSRTCCQPEFDMTFEPQFPYLYHEKLIIARSLLVLQIYSEWVPAIQEKARHCVRLKGYKTQCIHSNNGSKTNTGSWPVWLYG